MASDIDEKDEFELKLQEQREVLKKCQEAHNTNSCFKCEKMIGCEIRQEYVSAVYLSMNKNQSGGFEF